MKEPFEPRDAEYSTRVEKSFGRQEIMRTIGATLAKVSPGFVEIEFPYQPELTQQHGFIHAGIVATILDSACGYAAFSLMSSEAAVLTIEFKVNLLAPASGEHFYAVGRVKKSGRTISVAEGELFATKGAERKLVATMVGTIMAIYDRKGVES